jgi:repressor of nif and glnA expression
MNLLTKEHASQRRIIEILRVIKEVDKPIGARAISDLLRERGYEIGERAVRYNLKILDELGFTKKSGYIGRTLTQLGLRELSDALINDRMGFVNTRIEEYMFRTTFDPSSGGDVVVNTSLILKKDYERAKENLINTFNAGYTVSRRVLIADEGEEMAHIKVPPDCLGIATVCSITLDGILLRHGIPVNTSFAGVVDVSEGVFTEFRDLIAYSGSSLDPMKIFMARKMTDVCGAVKAGQGRVLANVREIPIAALNQAKELIARARKVGINGLINISDPGLPNSGCPVGSGKIGIALCAGVNSVMAIEETGIPIKTSPLSAMVDYGRMVDID